MFHKSANSRRIRTQTVIQHPFQCQFTNDMMFYISSYNEVFFWYTGSGQKMIKNSNLFSFCHKTVKIEGTLLFMLICSDFNRYLKKYLLLIFFKVLFIGRYMGIHFLHIVKNVKVLIFLAFQLHLKSSIKHSSWKKRSKPVQLWT